MGGILILLLWLPLLAWLIELGEGIGDDKQAVCYHSEAVVEGPYGFSDLVQPACPRPGDRGFGIALGGIGLHRRWLPARGIGGIGVLFLFFIFIFFSLWFLSKVADGIGSKEGEDDSRSL